MESRIHNQDLAQDEGSRLESPLASLPLPSLAAHFWNCKIPTPDFHTSEAKINYFYNVPVSFHYSFNINSWLCKPKTKTSLQLLCKEKTELQIPFFFFLLKWGSTKPMQWGNCPSYEGHRDTE